MMEQKFIDIRTLTLENIVALRTERWEKFRETINSSFTGHDFQELKMRFLKAKTPNNNLKIAKNLEYIETISKYFKEFAEKEAGILKRISEAQELYEFALNELEEAKKKVSLAEEILNRAKESLNAYNQEVETTNQLLKKSENDLENKKKLILIHPSTNLKQIIKYKDGIFVTTKSDFKLLEKIGCVDKVFEDEEFFVDVIPENLQHKYSKEELFSIVSYANMVICTSLVENNKSSYKLLYSNKDIDTLLKVNGFEL